jgi:anti-sigma factor RsiW
MSHQAMQELIALDAGGDLDETGRRRLERHLASCPACRDFAAEMRQSQRAVRGLAGVAVGEDLLAGVRAAVLQEIASAARRPAPVLSFPLRTLRAPRRWLAAAAAVLLTLGAGWWLSTRTPERTPVPRPKVVRYEPPPIEPPPVEEPAAVAETVAETAAPRIAAVDPPVRERRRAPDAIAETVQPTSQPMVVKWLVDDPDLVIYWLIETDETTEEPTHETKEA